MVLEALAAVSLGGSIVQFVQFSYSLITLTVEIKQSTSGLSSSHDDLQAIATDLHDYSVKFGNAKGSPTDSIDPFALNENLKDLAERSNVVAKELLDAVDGIRKKSQTSPSRRWNNFRQALRTVWAREKISSLKTRLETLRGQIELHLISEASTGQLLVKGSLGALRDSLNSFSLDQSDKLMGISQRLSAIEASLANPESSIALTELKTSSSRFSREVKRIAHTSQILKSLLFEGMAVRHSQIPEAHQRTFDWIYSPETLPDDDLRSKIAFKSWLLEGKGIYWITGKPGISAMLLSATSIIDHAYKGSGKSTLMRYLDDHRMTSQLLEDWSRPLQLVTATFYFWKSGTHMAKSLLGLLQSLLYFILRSIPELTAVLCPGRFDKVFAQAFAPWSIKELRSAFDALKLQENVPAKFYFHVDGLDEYEGDHYEVIRIIQDLAKSPSVKLCVSSRPWNCFHDTFGKSNDGTLQLHHLTRKDIELFAQENLSIYSNSLRSAAQSQAYNELVHDIGERAQGVFQWVRLAVHSLREGLSNGDQISLLRTRLEDIPTDLEALFKAILESVDGIYRERMACTLLAALVRPLKIIHYSFLEEEDPRFGLELPFTQFDEQELSDRVVETHRRLNGRYKGLLEAISLPLTAHTGIDFLHRTLHDFLQTPEMKMFLASRLPPSYNVLSTMVRALIADIKFVHRSPGPEDFAAALEIAHSAAMETGDLSYEYFVLDHVESTCNAIWPSGLLGTPGVMMGIAVHIGRSDYVQHRLRDLKSPVELHPLLMHALMCPIHKDKSFATIFEKEKEYDWLRYASSPFCFKADLFDMDGPGHTLEPGLVRLLLEKGANPNWILERTSIWREFLLHFICREDPRRGQEGWDVFEYMVQYGADIGKQVDLLLELAQSGARLVGEQFRQLVRGFEILLNHGFNPNSTYEGKSIWVSFMTSLANRHPNAGDAEPAVELIQKFLLHGASTTALMIPPKRNRQGSSWLHRFLQRHLSANRFINGVEPAGIFEVFLKYGLDPDTAFDGSTVWGRLLETLQRTLVRGLHLQRIERDLVLLFLRYGADPSHEALYRIMGWQGGSTCGFEQDYAREIELAIHREISWRQKLDQAVRVPSSVSPYAYSHDPPSSSYIMPSPFAAEPTSSADNPILRPETCTRTQRRLWQFLGRFSSRS